MISTDITSNFSVSAQPQIADFKLLAEKGIALVINDRPDREDSEQPGSATEAEAARDAGMAYRHIPVTAATISEVDIRTFQTAVSDANGPVLAHCKTGTRSLTLWVLGEVLDGRMTEAEVLPFGKRFGFDLTAATLWLAKSNGKGTQ